MAKTRNLPRLKKIIAFLGLEKSIVGLLSMVVLVGMGEHMAEQYLPRYLLALGGGFLSVGFLNGMDNLLGALYSFPGGYFSDLLGSKRALLLFNIIAIFGFILVILFPYWWMVLVAAAFFLSWTAISLPATMSLVSSVLPKSKRTMGVTMHSLVRRIPMALGPLFGGFLAASFGDVQGIRISFIFAIFFAILAIILQQKLISEENDKKSTAKPEKNPFRLYKLMNPSLKSLLVSDILVRFCEQIPYAFVIIWATGSQGNPGIIPVWQFGILRTIEMAVAILVYIPVAYFADKTEKKPFVVATFLFFTIFPVVLLLSKSFPMLIIAFIIRGLKEFGEPSRKAMILDLAPEANKAGIFGLYYLIRDVVVSVAAFGGAFLWQTNPSVNLLTAFGFGVLGTLWFAFFGKGAQTTSQN